MAADVNRISEIEQGINDIKDWNEDREYKEPHPWYVQVCIDYYENLHQPSGSDLESNSEPVQKPEEELSASMATLTITEQQQQEQKQNPDKEMEVKVKPGPGHTDLVQLLLLVKPSDLVKDMMQQINDKTGLTQDDYVLVYQTKRMDPNFTIGAFYLTASSTIHMVLRGLKGGAGGKRQRGNDDDDADPIPSIIRKPDATEQDLPEVSRALGLDDINIQGWVDTLSLGDLKALHGIYSKNKGNGNTDSHINAYIKFLVEYRELEVMRKRTVTVQNYLKAVFKSSLPNRTVFGAMVDKAIVKEEVRADERAKVEKEKSEAAAKAAAETANNRRWFG